MYPPQKTNSSDVFVDTFGEYLQARLKADPAVSDIDAPFDRAQQDLARAFDRRRSAVRTYQEALAAREYALFLLLRQVSRFQLAALAFVDRDRGSPVYKRFFPDGVTPVVERPPLRLIEAVLVMEADLAVSTDTSGLASWREPLSTHRAMLEAAVAAVSQARITLAEAWANERAARAYWLAAYRSAYAELTKRFPLDRARVESFFRRGRKSRRAAAAADSQGAGTQPAKDVRDDGEEASEAA